jgi:hypothetical protein
MIDWEQVARVNGLTQQEFEKEILTVAACLGVMRIDNGDAGEADTLKFTCNDQVSEIAVYVKRLPKTD